MTAPLTTLRRPRVHITGHAADRYRERAKPYLTRKQALAELDRLVKLGQFIPAPPDWCDHLEGGGDSFLLAGDVLLVLRFGRRSWCATTCIVRGSLSERDLEARREEKRLRKQRKRAHRGAMESHARNRRLKIDGKEAA